MGKGSAKEGWYFKDRMSWKSCSDMCDRNKWCNFMSWGNHWCYIYNKCARTARRWRGYRVYQRLQRARWIAKKTGTCHHPKGTMAPPANLREKMVEGAQQEGWYFKQRMTKTRCKEYCLTNEWCQYISWGNWWCYAYPKCEQRATLWRAYRIYKKSYTNR